MYKCVMIMRSPCHPPLRRCHPACRWSTRLGYLSIFKIYLKKKGEGTLEFNKHFNEKHHYIFAKNQPSILNNNWGNPKSTRCSWLTNIWSHKVILGALTQSSHWALKTLHPLFFDKIKSKGKFLVFHYFRLS